MTRGSGRGSGGEGEAFESEGCGLAAPSSKWNPASLCAAAQPLVSNQRQMCTVAASEPDARQVASGSLSDVHNCVHLRHVQPEGALSQHQLPRLSAVPAAREGTHRQCLLSKGSMGGRDACAHSARLLGGAPKPVLQGACGQFAHAPCMPARPARRTVLLATVAAHCRTPGAGKQTAAAEKGSAAA